jgi:hypothetical protein
MVAQERVLAMLHDSLQVIGLMVLQHWHSCNCRGCVVLLAISFFQIPMVCRTTRQLARAATKRTDTSGGCTSSIVIIELLRPDFRTAGYESTKMILDDINLHKEHSSDRDFHQHQLAFV